MQFRTQWPIPETVKLFLAQLINDANTATGHLARATTDLHG
jgi:hypothetical protein